MIAFSSPIWLWGATLAAMPWVIHLIGFRPRNSRTIASLMWLDTFQSKEQRRQKIKDWWVLLLRSLMILVVFISLAGPKFESNSSRLCIDNHPAAWSQKENWLPQAINLLPEGEYDVFLRGDDYLGKYSKQELVPVFLQTPSSLEALPPGDSGIVVSFGYTQLQGNAAKYILPIRQLLNNTSFDWEWKQGNLSIGLKNPMGNQTIELFEGQTLLSTWTESATISKEMLKDSTSYSVRISGDEIVEDNSISWVHFIPSSWYVLTYEMGCKGIDEWLPDDAVITTYTGKSDFENLPNSGVLVLNGFPFIPEAALSFDGIIFQFPERIEGSELRQPLPILEDPFYRDHFIGPSLGQKWPNPQSGEKLEFMDRVLFADGEAPLAGFIENNSSTIYRQGFSVEQWDHPYFLALKSWARKSIQVEIPRPLALGDDAYELTLSQIPRDNIQFYNPENKALNVNEVQSFFSLEKIALLLALLFALIAIIFVKIS